MTNFKISKIQKRSLCWSMFCEHSIHQGRKIKLFAWLRRWCGARWLLRCGWWLRFTGGVWGHTVGCIVSLARRVETALEMIQPEISIYIYIYIRVHKENLSSKEKLNERGTVSSFLISIVYILGYWILRSVLLRLYRSHVHVCVHVLKLRESKNQWEFCKNFVKGNLNLP